MSDLATDALMEEPSVKSLKTEPKLVINADTWHFQYFKFIRRQWGLSPPRPQTSLCPYCQTMFWGSVALAGFGIFIFAGWLEVRLFRFLYKKMPNRMKLWFERPAVVLDKSSSRWENNFAVTALTVAFVSLVSAAILCVFGWIVFWAGWKGFFIIPEIPGALWTAALYIGWAMFYACAGVGWFMDHTWYGISWFFTNGGLWTTTGLWVAGLAGGAVVLAGLGFGVYTFLSSNLMKGWVDWALDTVNGFKTAREQAQLELAVVRRAEQEKQESVEPTGFWKWWASLWSFEVDLSGVGAKVLGPLGILWAYIKAAKRGVCPLISFVDASGEPIPDPRDAEDDDDDYYGRMCSQALPDEDEKA
jgi:hypothetical protein